MPVGPITYTNRALKRVSGDPGYIFYPTNISPGLLRIGTNTLAVELHINSPVIPSLGFDMELLASGYAGAVPSLSATVVGGQIRLSWPANTSAFYGLYSKSSLAAPADWAAQVGTVQTNGTRLLMEVSLNGNSRYFRLQQQ
jgi:hypothetical protein